MWGHVTRRAPAAPPRIPAVTRRLATSLLAAVLIFGMPGAAQAADAADLFAQSQNGGLSEAPKPAGGGISESAKPSAPTSTASAADPAELPFTGTDPRITLLLGFAALLAGAGLRMRTGDVRDY